jgi:hypothetical protein
MYVTCNKVSLLESSIAVRIFVGGGGGGGGGGSRTSLMAAVFQTLFMLSAQQNNR